MERFDLTDNFHSVARCMWYTQSAIDGNSGIQQQGIMCVVDYRGEWKSSPLQFVRLLSAFPFHATPVHNSSLHGIYPNAFKYDIIQTIRRALPNDVRMRVRLHRGSPLEMEYGLRGFGIDLSRQLFQESAPSTGTDKNDEHSFSCTNVVHSLSMDKKMMFGKASNS